jgi:hypothetical protein
MPVNPFSRAMPSAAQAMAKMVEIHHELTKTFKPSDFIDCGQTPGRVADEIAVAARNTAYPAGFL